MYATFTPTGESEVTLNGTAPESSLLLLQDGTARQTQAAAGFRADWIASYERGNERTFLVFEFWLPFDDVDLIWAWLRDKRAAIRGSGTVKLTYLNFDASTRTDVIANCTVQLRFAQVLGKSAAFELTIEGGEVLDET